jgi:hypothetical protein
MQSGDTWTSRLRKKSRKKKMTRSPAMDNPQPPPQPVPVPYHRRLHAGGGTVTFQHGIQEE